MIELCCENLSSNAPYRIEMHRTELNLLKDKLKTSKKAYRDVFCVKKKIFCKCIQYIKHCDKSQRLKKIPPTKKTVPKMPSFFFCEL